MWNTWNIHRMMSESSSQNRVFKSTIKEGWGNKAREFGDETESRDTRTNCESEMRVQAYYTGSGEALRDFFIVDARARDSSGSRTNLETDIAEAHKIRYNIDHKEDGEWVTQHQGEFYFPMEEGDWQTSPLHLITKPGEWRVQMDSITTGTCAAIHGVHTVGTMTAKETTYTCAELNRKVEPDLWGDNEGVEVCGDCIEGYVQDEETGQCVVYVEQGEDYTPPTDYNNLYLALGGLLGLAIVLKKKRKKAD